MAGEDDDFCKAIQVVGQTKAEVLKLLKKKGLQTFSTAVLQYMLEGRQRVSILLLSIVYYCMYFSF